jgi:hypothetical protein
MKRTVEVEDTLKERVESAIDDVKDLLVQYLADNPDLDEVPCINNDLDYDGRVHEIVDGSVPIYTGEIEDTWYLYGSDLERAYENAGVGENPKENDGMAAIYFYIMEEVQEWYRDNAEDIFEDWKEKQEAALEGKE